MASTPARKPKVRLELFPDTTPTKKESTKYTMTISRQTVDKLGVKMYDRVSAVVAEFIANNYDANGNPVKVSVLAGQWLARKVYGSTIRELGTEIYPATVPQPATDAFYHQILPPLPSLTAGQKL